MNQSVQEEEKSRRGASCSSRASPGCVLRASLPCLLLVSPHSASSGAPASHLRPATSPTTAVPAMAADLLSVSFCLYKTVYMSLIGLTLEFLFRFFLLSFNCVLCWSKHTFLVSKSCLIAPRLHDFRLEARLNRPPFHSKKNDRVIYSPKYVFPSSARRINCQIFAALLLSGLDQLLCVYTVDL